MSTRISVHPREAGDEIVITITELKKVNCCVVTIQLKDKKSLTPEPTSVSYFPNMSVDELKVVFPTAIVDSYD